MRPPQLAALSIFQVSRLACHGLGHAVRLLWFDRSGRLTLSWIAKKDPADVVEGTSARSCGSAKMKTTPFTDFGAEASDFAYQWLGQY
jgi:hypothetical protein